MCTEVLLAVDVGGIGHAVTDPIGFLLDAISSVLGRFASGASADIGGILDRFLFRTVDPTVAGNRPLTANPNIAHLNFGVTLAVDLLVTVVMLVTSLRSMFERSMRSKYDLKVILPRVLAAVVLAHCSLTFMQLLIDLNNALSSVALALGGAPLNASALPWAPSLGSEVIGGFASSQNLFRLVMVAGLVVATAILGLTYVVRTVLLNVLIVTAPLAALLSVIPDTRGHAHSWVRLFLGTLFMQAVQLVILRVSVVMELDSSGGLLTTVYALATLWLMLKVPGAMSAGVHLENKAHTMLHSLERSVHHRVMPPHRATHRKSA